MSKIAAGILCAVLFYAYAFGGTVESFNLKNGIKVIYKKSGTSDIVALKIYSPVSVLHEDVSKAGVTSLLYNVMNKSTKNRNAAALAEDIENLGSSISTEVEYDYSGFSLASMSENFDKTVEILADMILNPAFDEKELEKEKILNSEVIKSRQDSISKTANDKFICDFYGPAHPYSYPVYGKIETLNSVTRADLIKMYEKIYSNKGIIITVVGNVSKKELVKSLEKYFLNLKLTQPQPEKIKFAYIKRNDSEVIADSKFNQAFITYAYDAPNVYDKDFVTLKVISSILGGRMTGRLFIELREKLGLAYEVNSIYPTRIDRSYFEIYIGLDKKNIETAKKGIEKITADLCNTAVSEEELKDTKNFIKGVYLLDHQPVERQAYYMAVREILGLGYEYDAQYMSVLGNVTSEDILNAANKYFKSIPYKLIMTSESGDK